MSEGLRILIVEDDPAIRRFLRTGLTAQGHRPSEVETGRAALAALARGAVDLVVLDLGLPDIDGLEVIRDLRAAGNAVPVIVLSSRDAEAAKVAALDLGADDYITKPFGIDELYARIRAAERHRLQRQGEAPVFRSGWLMVDLVRRIVTVSGREVKLTPREYDAAAAAGRACGQGADAPDDPARGVGRRRPTCSICVSTSAPCARRSRPNRTARATS